MLSSAGSVLILFARYNLFSLGSGYKLDVFRHIANFFPPLYCHFDQS